MNQLQGHKVLITGGTHGVGAAIASAIAVAGGDVCLVGAPGKGSEEMAETTAAHCRSFGVRAEWLLQDLSLPPDNYLEDLIKQLDERMPGIDMLVNNVGTCIDVPFLEMDFEKYQQTLQLNVTSGYFLTQAFCRRWVASQTAGRIVFTGSINGILSELDHTAYDASKGAIAALVRSLCVSLAPHGIRVNAMAPGLVRTPLTAHAIDNPEFNSWMRLHTPNGQLPGPEVCGETVVFLLSDGAKHIHGQSIYVDGGMSAWQQPDLPAGLKYDESES